jgi:hypothetical protein
VPSFIGIINQKITTMRFKLYFYIALISMLALPTFVAAQGCVAVKNMSSCSLIDSISPRSLQASLNYRYFRSFRHFRGSHEEKNRVEQGTEVINNDNSWVLGLAYNFNRRWSASIAIPVIYIDRSSLYEHKGNASGERYHTSSKGLGDIRLTAYYSMLPQHKKLNLVAGLGVKLPTGEYNYKDDFHTNNGIVRRAVDQSIQPGDGGTAAISEINLQYKFTSSFNGYATGYYLFNPRNTNGTLRSANLTANIPLSNEMSVADQFLFRAGALYQLNVVNIGLGMRYEGIPVEDVFGDSDGFRRPGYIVSAEASFNYTKGNHSISAQVPLALYRNRTRSVIDRARGIDQETGEPFHGDAAFADWLVSLTYSYRLQL